MRRNLRAWVRVPVDLGGEVNSGDAWSDLDFTVTFKRGQKTTLVSRDGWFPCRILDMSDQGFLFVCNETFGVGQILSLRCELYLEKIVECKVEIRHTEASGTGAKIVEIDAKNTALCQLFLQEHYADKLNKLD